MMTIPDERAKNTKNIIIKTAPLITESWVFPRPLNKSFIKKKKNTDNPYF